MTSNVLPGNEEEPMNPNMTLEDAKAAAQDVRDEVLALLPAENIETVRVVDEAGLLECADDEYKWPGGATVTVAGDLDAEAYLRSVLAAFDGREGWTITDSIEDSAQAEVRRDDGLSVYARVVKDGKEVWVRSFSVCFPFDPGVGKKY
jgi:hypothetical protein